MKKITEKIYDTDNNTFNDNSKDNIDLNTIDKSGENADVIAVKPTKKRKLQTLRAAVVCLIILTFICGIIYPLSVTLVGQTAFPYEANGSQIIVTMPNGTQKVYGSELIGQNFESAEYMMGRVNLGAPSNLSPESEEFQKLLNERVTERREKLAAIGYTETQIPDELLTSGGSGVDPHITPEVAYFQVPVIVAARNAKATSEEDKITAESVNAIIKKYTEGKFLGIFGVDRVTVLLVNLALDGLI